MQCAQWQVKHYGNFSSKKNVVQNSYLSKSGCSFQIENWKESLLVFTSKLSGTHNEYYKKMHRTYIHITNIHMKEVLRNFKHLTTIELCKNGNTSDQIITNQRLDVNTTTL